MKDQTTKAATAPAAKTPAPAIPEPKLGTAQAAKPAAKSTPKTAPAPAPKAPTAPVSRKIADEGLHKLRVGDVFIGDKGAKYVVWFLNESRACASPLDSNIIPRTGDDGVVRFGAGKDSINISPDSLVEVIQSLGRQGLADHIEQRKNQPAEELMKNKTTKKPAKGAKKEGTGTPGIRAGSLGTYKDYSIASVARALAKKGWTFGEIRAWIDSLGIKASDQTIKLSIYWAGHPERPDHDKFKAAPLTNEQMPDRSKFKVEEKEKKKTAKPAPKKAAKPAAKAPVKTVPAKPAPKTGAKTPAEQIAALKKAKAAKAAAK